MQQVPPAPTGYEYMTATTLGELCSVVGWSCWGYGTLTLADPIPGDSVAVGVFCSAVTGGCMAREHLEDDVSCTNPDVYVYQEVLDVVGDFPITGLPPFWVKIRCP